MTAIDWTKPVQTKGGRKVRVLCTDGPDGMFPVIGIIEGETIPRRWSLLGTKDLAYGWDDVNLINVPEKRELWVNVWRQEDGLWWCGIHETRQKADELADNQKDSDRIACIRIEFHEGEGLS